MKEEEGGRTEGSFDVVEVGEKRAVRIRISSQRVMQHGGNVFSWNPAPYIIQHKFTK